jgi:outer membrane protein OmpA-like peptidoglycan-associated protein
MSKASSRRYGPAREGESVAKVKQEEDMVRRTAVQGVAVAAVALAALAGCGGDDGGNVPGSGAENNAPTTAASEMSSPAPSSMASSESDAPAEDSGTQGGLEAKLDEILQGSAITFEVQSAELTEEAKQTLQQVAEVVSANQDAKVEVVGTAGYEDADKATQLGQERADAVRDELVSAGVAEDRIEAVSKGNEDVLGDPEKAVTVDIRVVE